ncbi:MAG: septal ring lytic transglycosylase RlpA family protein [Proteobacteria bacterium]|nr:septal ring lytic transglycosylase RlpA family protein [Pseudomonadota bacterium]
MCVHRSIRVAYVAVLVGPATLVGTVSSKAQSLTDALAGPASQVAMVGEWATVTQQDPPKPTFDHWQAKIILAKPTLKHALKKAADAMHGLASYYGKGERTATGEVFDPRGLTAAHRTLPFGTRVRVTRVDTGDSVIVRINDRGPFKEGRVIDLSQRAAEDLRMTDKGLTAVKLEVLDREEEPRQAENVAQRSLRR